MEKNKIIKIGSRGSQLALWQSNWVKDKLEKLGYNCEIKIIKTQGDKIQNLSFDKIEGKGFFTKEIEDELVAGSIDFAVHSMKDMPTESTPELCITAISDRVDPRDTLVIRKSSTQGNGPLGLSKNAIIGTSSIRRKVQLKHLLPDVEIKDLRGNVPTRIQKLRSGDYDAIMLAAAGILRLNLDLSEFEVFHLDPQEFVPAPAQGVLAYQCRKEDTPMRKILQNIHSKATAELTNIERKVLNMMDGGCQVPLGVYCHRDQNDNFKAHAVYSKDGDMELRRSYITQNTSVGVAEKIVSQLNQ